MFPSLEEDGLYDLATKVWSYDQRHQRHLDPCKNGRAAAHVRLTQLASAFKKRSPGEQRAYENLRSTVLDHSS